MRVQRPFLSAISAILLLSAGCSATQTAKAPDPVGTSGSADLPALAGGEWKLTSLRLGGEPIAVASEARPTLAVEDTGKVHGLATLNRYFGQMELKAGGELQWAGPMGSTMMAGPEHLMDQEVRFLQALQGARKVSLRDGTLVLQDDAGQNVLEFHR